MPDQRSALTTQKPHLDSVPSCPRQVLAASILWEPDICKTKPGPPCEQISALSLSPAQDSKAPGGMSSDF